MTARRPGSVRLLGNVDISGAGLSLKLGSNTRDTNGKRPFTGGYVRTRDFRQCYGYFECEMQIANEPGVNNAFWLTSVRETEGDTRFELDVVEAKYPNVVQVTARRWLPDREVFSKLIDRGGHVWPMRTIAMACCGARISSSSSSMTRKSTKLRTRSRIRQLSCSLAML